MLATNKKSQIIQGDKKMLHYKNTVSLSKANSGKYLYITSSDEIKENEWFYNSRLDKVFKAVKSGIYNPREDFKIIATTNPELHKNGVAKIGLPFIEKYITEYNKLTPITTVLIEYDCPYNPSIFPDVWNPKLSEDGTVIIHNTQELFSRKEMEKAYYDALECNGDGPDFETWFEQNY